ncbi:MAG TPA: DUF2142 domain-containing protein [Baekduia sp.]|nr:DUF2142 domain-containing protein [Baekduia sp.]
MSRVRRLRLPPVPGPLALLLGVALVLGLAWTVATAPLQGPDEAEHVGYVQHLAETGKKPSATTGSGNAYGLDEAGALRDFGFGASRRHRLTRTPWAAADEHRFQVFEDGLPPGAQDVGSGPTSVGNNPPLYYAYAAIAWKLTPGGHFFGRVYAARLFGVLALLAMVVFGWLLAGEVFARRRLPQTVAAGFLAALPMNGFIAGMVNPDILLATVWTAFLWYALRTVRLGLAPGRAAMLSLIAVASFLTHGRGLAIVPVLMVALLVAWLRHSRTVRDTLRSAAASAGVVIAGLVVYRFAFPSSGGGSLYGGQADLATSGAFNLKQFLNSVWNFYLPKLDSTQARLGPGIGYRQIYVQQYFAGVFGSFEVYLPFWAYDVVQIIVGVAALALYTLGVVRWRRLLASWPVVVILGAAAFSMLFVLHFTSYRSLVGNGGTNPLIVGRYLLPLGGVFAILLAALVHGLPRRVGAVVGTLLLTILLMLSVGGLAFSVERFYA